MGPLGKGEGGLLWSTMAHIHIRDQPTSFGWPRCLIDLTKTAAGVAIQFGCLSSWGGEEQRMPQKGSSAAKIFSHFRVHQPEKLSGGSEWLESKCPPLSWDILWLWWAGDSWPPLTFSIVFFLSVPQRETSDASLQDCYSGWRGRGNNPERWLREPGNSI